MQGIDVSSWVMSGSTQGYYYAGDNILQGLLLGMAAGAFTGTISGIATKRKKFIINGSIEKWKPVRIQLAMMSKKSILFKPRAMGYPNRINVF